MSWLLVVYESVGGNILGFFLAILMNFSRMCLREQIFRVLLELFISEVTAESNVLGSF